MSHIDLESYYRTLFACVQYHKWDGEWLESLMPFEWDVMLIQLRQHLDEEKARQKQQEKQMAS
jgi:hypothetical protein